MLSVNFRSLFKAMLLWLPFLWLAIFWYVRNPIIDIPTSVTAQLKVDPRALENHVVALSTVKPNRSYKNLAALEEAQHYIERMLTSMNYAIELQEVDAEGKIYHNVIARWKADSSAPPTDDIFVVGAHYDAAGPDNPGADDNASGVAGLLEVARLFSTTRPRLRMPVEFVFYTLEEPPWFATGSMGSVYHADKMHDERKNVVMMLSLEMIGYFSDDFLSQHFDIPLLYAFYPWTGNFIGVVGAPADRAIQRHIKRIMSANSSVPIYSISAPADVPGIDYSDHRSYWAHDWPAFMITDTAFLRNEQYHLPMDISERLNYTKMAEVTRGIYAAVLTFSQLDSNASH